MRAWGYLVVALTASACSALPPPPKTPLAQAQATHEYPSAPVHQTALGLPTATDAIDVFATAYINWTAATVSSRMRALAKLSVGQARSAVLLAAAQTAQDYELARSGIANSGTVEAIAPLAGSGDEYVVVTKERTSASNTTAYRGLAAAWHLSLASVARVPTGGWAVSSWQPEN
jgi:hypothetical protein